MNFNIYKTCQLNHSFYQQLLTHYFDDKPGYFVDVGANDGLECSNTSCLVEAGWNGIMIEPLPNEFKNVPAHTKIAQEMLLYITVEYPTKKNLLFCMLVEDYQLAVLVESLMIA